MSKRIATTANKSALTKRHQPPQIVVDCVSPSKLHYDPPKGVDKFDVLNYLKVEVLGIGEPGQLDPPQNENIMNFLNVPWQLESLLFFGCIICLDAFLYVITYLPIRVLFSAILFLFESMKKIARVFNKDLSYPSMFHRTQVYDLMRGLMMVIGVLVLRHINMSQVYHFIRGQNMIKLYVLASMMEVMDKLFASFGQDAFDALHIQTRSNPKSFKLLQYFLIACLYVVAHSALYFFEVATYTVVVNSSDEALLTVLILNNFAELKSFVFKKFDNNNLFQLACSDITERFQITLFLMTIMFVAVTQNDFNLNELAPGFIRILALMAIGESIADSVKHAFINKFNSISPDVYEDFAFVLRLDILGNRKDKIILDHSYAVTRRLGLSQIPLGCVFIRYVMLATSAPTIQTSLAQMMWRDMCMVFCMIFSVLVVVKVILGIGLLIYADKAQRKADAQLAQMDCNVNSITPGTASKQSKLELVEELATIERYTVYKGRIL